MHTYCISATSKSSSAVNVVNQAIAPSVVLLTGNSYIMVKGSLDEASLDRIHEHFHVHDHINVENLHLYEY